MEFLGFVVGPDGIRMDETRVSAIKQWPVPKSFRDIQVFLGFTNFYRRFIQGYSRVLQPLTEMLNGPKRHNNWGRAQSAYYYIYMSEPSSPCRDPLVPDIAPPFIKSRPRDFPRSSRVLGLGKLVITCPWQTRPLFLVVRLTRNYVYIVCYKLNYVTSTLLSRRLSD